MLCPSGKVILWTWGLISSHRWWRTRSTWISFVEVPDIADDGVVLHLLHVLRGDNVDTAGCGDHHIGDLAGVVHGHDLVAFHGGLQGADGIYLRDDNARCLGLERLAAALAHIARKPATTATLPASMTSVARMMPSTSECLQP